MGIRFPNKLVLYLDDENFNFIEDYAEKTITSNSCISRRLITMKINELIKEQLLKDDDSEIDIKNNIIGLTL